MTNSGKTSTIRADEPYIVDTKNGPVNFQWIDDALEYLDFEGLNLIELAIVADALSDRFREAVAKRHNVLSMAAKYNAMCIVREAITNKIVESFSKPEAANE